MILRPFRPFARRQERREERGQVLVMVAVALTGLLGFCALVVDVGMLWNAQQSQRAMADSAALAGAQEMQVAGTRGLNSFTREEGRGAAMASIVEQVGGSGLPTCATGGAPADSDADTKLGYAADVRNCAIPGTDYLVSVLTPSPLCVDCYDTARNIMVEVTHEDVPTFFAGLFGVNGWTSRQTSVAAIGYRADFAVMTLRPPADSYTGGPCCDALQNNVSLAGTAELRVSVGDIGTNTNMVMVGASENAIDEGYMVHHFDHYQAWGTAPPGRRLFAMIDDPNYPMPTRTGGTTFNNLAAAKMTDPQCTTERTKVPAQYEPIWDAAISDIDCLKPGIYTFNLDVGNSDLVLFTPGVYFLDGGMDIKGVAVGGYEANMPGVSLIANQNKLLKARNIELFSLNAGTVYGSCTGTPPDQVCTGEEAHAARGFNDVPVETGTGPMGDDPNLVISLMVAKDANCQVVRPYPTACNDANNMTINMSGGSELYVAGVQYAPSDNVEIGGGSGGTGHAGRIVAWTVRYTGNADVTQAYPGMDQGNGILRLDQACAGGGSTGMRHASCNP